MARASGLGRGLASLIPQKKKTVEAENEANYFGGDESTAKKAGIGDIALKSVIEVPINTIVPNPFQPRKHFHEEKLQELSESIKIHGIIQPLVVTRKGIDQYELIAGERRWQASKLAGIEKVPVVVKNVDDQQKLEMALIENIQRHDLDPIEQGRSFKQMQDLFSLTQEEIGQRVGKSRSAVTNTMRLLNLPIEIQKALQEGKISEGHARTILSVSNPEKQRALFELILKENLNVRQVEDRVREISVQPHKRRIKDADPELSEKEQQLSQVLGTRVKIKKTPKGGQLMIEFFSPEEYDSLCKKLAALE